jgi:malonate-semialdehyde dehydrogenase (acetylating)/methylmalonate-semialdehyde dehydrogenase
MLADDWAAAESSEGEILMPDSTIPVTEATAEFPLTQVIPHFIGGQVVQGTSGRFVAVHDPALGKLSGRVAFASKAEVDRAVEVASAAFPRWAAMPPLRRARILNRFRELLEQNQVLLSSIITSEHGKVLSGAKGEVQRCIEVVEFATGISQLLKGEYTEQVGTDVDSYSIRQRSGWLLG